MTRPGDLRVTGNENLAASASRCRSAAEIDRIIKRMADPTLVVPSPIIGRITARNAAVDFADSHAKLMLRAFDGMFRTSLLRGVATMIAGFL